MTATELLAEVKTLQKRREKKQEFISAYLAREDRVRDPHEKSGGSPEVLRREFQALNDLEERIVQIRCALMMSNITTAITVGKAKRTVFGWLAWRRDVAPGQVNFYRALFNKLATIRANAQRAGQSIRAGAEEGKPTDIVVNLDESQLGQQIEGLEEVLGTLDGQLSMVNATTQVAGA